MGKRENKVESYLDEQVNLIGGLTRKWVSPGRDGVPDRIVVLIDKIRFVEIKTVDGVLSSCQRRECVRLAQAGAEVWVLSGKVWVDKFTKHVKGKVRAFTHAAT